MKKSQLILLIKETINEVLKEYNLLQESDILIRERSQLVLKAKKHAQKFKDEIKRLGL